MLFLDLALSLLIIGQDAPAADAAKAAEADASVPMVDPFSYTYNPFGKRDPFESFIREQSTARPASDNPLLNFQLTNFKLTGILWGLANPKAIVEDGEGRGHIISRGTRIGVNRGRVLRILKDQVVIAEEYRDPLGKLMVSEFYMKIAVDENKK